MSEKICGIVGSDEIYMRRLMSAMNSNDGFMLRTQIFTDVDALHRYIEEHSIDILVVDDGINIGKIPVNSIIYLVGEKSCEKNQIYKFQSVNNIIKQIMEISGEGSGEVSDLNIIGIYSPAESNEKTLTALLVARFYGREHKTLYINFEEFSGLINELPPHNYDLSDVAYMYRDSRNILEQKLAQIIVKDIYFDYIAAVECPTDISFISTWQWLEIVKFVAEKCNYDYVVIDAGSLMQNPWQIIQACSVVYVPVNNNLILQNKIKAFEKYLILIGKENLMNKIKYIELPVTFLKEGESIMKQLDGTEISERVVKEISDR
ncbi:MAG: hypothetical protein ACI4EV_07305 [Lachnospiraceae bacterium]